LLLPKSPGAKKESALLRLSKSLLSIGLDASSAEKLASARGLERVVVPLYWKDGLVLNSHLLLLSKLPSFLKSFEKEFPDGEVRWDPDYEDQNPPDGSGNVAIRVFFSYQEDDQGDHWSPKPTALEEKSYGRMLERYSHKGPGAIQASAALRGE
jgi:hypothetical protein